MKCLSLLCLICLGLAMPSRASAQSSAGADQDNIVVVLDASGSMREPMKKVKKSKMEAAKEALEAVMREVPPTTNVGLLVFSGSNLKNDWVYPLKPVEPAALSKAIHLPTPGGGTPLGA
jgi:Mg-chelatase subunit ChlD